MNEDPIKYLIPELKIDEWLPIEYFQYIPHGVTAIHCDLLDMCKAHCNFNLCEYLGVQLNCVFKKSNKKFER